MSVLLRGSRPRANRAAGRTRNKRGWVRGVVTCRDTSEKDSAAPPANLVRILDVQSGLVTYVSSDLAMTQVPRSTRWAFVSEGKVSARTPEGQQVRVDVDKLDAARTLGYRLLSDAELGDSVPPSLSPPTGDRSTE
ncbi:hypothetical protein NVS55_29415 [Myxococcus stipitatus]|uniref:hypothetical protein n=1 Tax=Myxococcus stipitatus TaxID=83455 RepID=UPI003145034B